MPSADTVQLRFYTFSLEKKENTDYVKVYDGEGESDDLLGIYDMSHPPPRVVSSTGSQMFIVFHSNDAGSSTGFNATYQTKGNVLLQTALKILIKKEQRFVIFTGVRKEYFQT